MAEKTRIDLLLVERGMFASRAAARASIDAGLVKVAGRRIDKPSAKVDREADIAAEPAHPYVSRGGLKLAHALDVFGIDPARYHCADLGASTGGFTDVLLQRGADRIVAIDVGRNQLHPNIRRSPKVTAKEQTDIRSVSSEDIDPHIQLLVADLSFISLEKALPTVLDFMSGGTDLVALFKPQFQVGRDYVGKGGIVSNSDAVKRAKTRFDTWLTDRGWRVLGWSDSPISGGDGNQEYLVHARKRGGD
ncbi:MAG: TlyA family RNA methyltransferase [Pseudomonadota bacterium]